MTQIQFNEARLLDRVSYGSEFGHEFFTSIKTLASGQERRNARWSYPLGRYTVNFEALHSGHHEIVKAAHMASMGALIPFRFKDWVDFEAVNQFVGVGTGATEEYQLTRNYQFGSVEIHKPIKKPVSGTVRVFVDGDEVSGFTVDHTSGVLTISAPAGGVITWSGEFDVPVRFDQDRLDMQPYNKNGNGFILSSNVTLSEVLL